MNYLDYFMIIVAKYFIIIPILLFIFVFIKNINKWKKIFLYAILCVIFVLVLSFIVSKIYYDARPFVVNNVSPLIPHTPDNGFPSDHTLLAATVSSIIIPFSMGLGIISWIITILIGGARMYAGLHHLIDIIGGIIVPIISSILAFYLTILVLPNKITK